MAIWKYQTVLPDGVSVYGIIEAASEASLRDYFAARGQQLVAATELSVNRSLEQDVRLSRLLRLRLSDRVREALLTGLPLDVAVRALAEEPVDHPLQLLSPWLTALAVTSAGVLLLSGVMIPAQQPILFRLALVLVLVAIPVHLFLRWSIAQRPRRILRWMAKQLERGEVDVLKTSRVLPREVRELLNSGGDERSRYCSAAQLIPELSGMRIRSHQLALALVGPLILFSLMILTLYVATFLIVPTIADSIQVFGLSLSWLTELVLSMGRLTSSLGWSGILGLTAILTTTCVVVYLMVSVPRAAEALDRLPLLGTSLRWQMQARVSRFLSVLLRNETAPEDAICLAAKASGSPAAAAEGEIVARSVRTSEPLRGDLKRLSGLPLAALKSIRPDGDGESSRETQALMFEQYAASLEQASRGNLALLATLMEAVFIVVVGVFSLILILGLLLPLINLINQLAVV